MSRRAPRKKASSGDWHPADVKAALEKAGWSLRQIAHCEGLSSTALAPTLYRSYPRGEYLIAERLGLRAEEIWPSRYHADGMPKRGRWTPPHCKAPEAGEESAA